MRWNDITDIKYIMSCSIKWFYIKIYFRKQYLVKQYIFSYKYLQLKLNIILITRPNIQIFHVIFFQVDQIFLTLKYLITWYT